MHNQSRERNLVGHRSRRKLPCFLDVEASGTSQRTNTRASRGHWLSSAGRGTPKGLLVANETEESFRDSSSGFCLKGRLTLPRSPWGDLSGVPLTLRLPTRTPEEVLSSLPGVLLPTGVCSSQSSNFVDPCFRKDLAEVEAAMCQICLLTSKNRDLSETWGDEGNFWRTCNPLVTEPP